MPKLFKPGHSSVPEERRDVNKIIKEDSGVYWVKNYIQAENAMTTFRIIPAVDENGEEEVALNPDASQDTPLSERLGSVAYFAEIMQATGTNRSSFITGVFTDRQDRVVKDRYSVGQQFQYKMKYKLKAISMCQAAGRDIGAPPLWGVWAKRYAANNSFLVQPTIVVMFQVMLSQEAGVVMKNVAGAPDWKKPCVLALPTFRMQGLLADLVTRNDSTQPLSLENNLFGDICSCKTGCCLRMRKTISKATGKEGKAVYTISLDRSTPIPLSVARELWRPWENIVVIPTIEDVIENLIEAYDPVAVDYALAETVYEEYIPENARGTSSNIRQDNLKALAAELGISGTDFPPPAAPPFSMKPRATESATEIGLPPAVEEPDIKLPNNPTTVNPEDKRAYERAMAAMSRTAKKS